MQHSKKLGKPHGTQTSSNTFLYSSINVLSNKPRTSLFSVPIHFSFPVKALIDTGAFSSAMPLSVFHKLQNQRPNMISQFNPASSIVKVANGTSIATFGSFNACFKIADETFSERFLILKSMNQTILGLPFFEQNDIVIHPRTRTLKLPHITLQLTERIHKHGKISSLQAKKNLFLRATQSVTVNPNSSGIVVCSLNHVTFPEDTIAMVEPNPKFEKETGLCVTSAIFKLDKDNKVSLGVINVLPHKLTIGKDTSIARITILTAKQAEKSFRSKATVITW